MPINKDGRVSLSLSIYQTACNAGKGSNLSLDYALGKARKLLGDAALLIFLTKVPEQGDALWLRFKKFQGGDNKLTFEDFINSELGLKATAKKPRSMLGATFSKT